MLAAGIVELFVRMVVSLGFVLSIVAVAYLVMRRRAGLTGRVSSRLAGGRGAATRPSRGALAGQPRQRAAARRSSRQHVEVIGRVGLTRTSSAVVVKFADRVLLVGAAEQGQPTVLAELDVATWELYDQDAEWTVPLERGSQPALDIETGADAAPGVPRPGFIDALREATVRRA
jgi:flagellar biogenesis protein FliO